MADVYEKIDHPAHYGGDTPYECIKVLDAWGLGRAFAVASCIKYLSRMGKKPDTSELDDLKKVRWYVNYLISKHEGDAEF